MSTVCIYYIQKDTFYFPMIFITYYNIYLQTFAQVLFGKRFCTKYLICSSHLDIKLAFCLGGVYFSSLTKLSCHFCVFFNFLTQYQIFSDHYYNAFFSEQVVFDIKLSTKYLVSPSRVEIILAFYQG